MNPIMKRYIASSSFSMFHITIDTFEDGVIAGRIYNPTRQEPMAYRDWHGFLMAVNNLLDANGNPMPAMELRGFTGASVSARYTHRPALVHQYEDFLDTKGDIATYDLVINSRHEATWQGILIDGDDACEFTHLMTLMKRMTDTLEEETQ